MMATKEQGAYERELWDLIAELRSVSDRLTKAAEKRCRDKQEKESRDADK